jgi:hypothetical protein
MGGIAVRWETVRRPARLRYTPLRDGYIQKLTATYDWLERNPAAADRESSQPPRGGASACQITRARPIYAPERSSSRYQYGFGAAWVLGEMLPKTPSV